MKKVKNLLPMTLGLLFFVVGILLFVQSRQITTEEKLGYSETSKSNYKVYLNDKKYYNKDYLEEGMKYITSIIDYIDLDFLYDIKFEKELNYDYQTSITATTKIMDADTKKIIYENVDILKDIDKKSIKNSDNITASDNVRIDYKTFNKRSNDFRMTYGLNTISVLEVKYNVMYKNDFTNKHDLKTITISIPLSEQTIAIEKPADLSKKSTIVNETNSSEFNKKLMIISIMFIALGSLIEIVSIIDERKSKFSNKYEKYVHQLLSKYDSYITIAKEESELDKPKIEISTFKELFDVRNNEEKAIIYIKESDTRSKFMIIGDNNIYYYIADASDFK